MFRTDGVGMLGRDRGLAKTFRDQGNQLVAK